MVKRSLLRRVSRPVSAFEVVKEDGSIVPLYNARKGNDKFVDCLDVDQFSGQKFMINPQGFVMNDIMVFEQCQSDSVARAVLQRIKVLHPQSISQDLTKEEMFASVIPANYGSPAEFVKSQTAVVSRVLKLRAAEAAFVSARSKQMDLDIPDLSNDPSKEMEGAIPKNE